MRNPTILSIVLLLGAPACRDSDCETTVAENAPPAITLLALPGVLAGAPGLSVEVRFAVDDPDSIALSDVVAVPFEEGASEILVAQDVVELNGAEEVVSWDTTGVDEGLWGIEIRARDGEHVVVASGPAVITLVQPGTGFPAPITEGGGGNVVPTALAVALDGGAFVAGEVSSGNPVYFGESGAELLVQPSPSVIDVFLARYASDGALQWVARTVGLEPKEEGVLFAAVQADSVIAEPDGGATVAGLLAGHVVLGAGEPNEVVLTHLQQGSGTRSLFLARWSAAGALQWAVSAAHVDGSAVDAASLGQGRTVVVGHLDEDERNPLLLGAGEPNETQIGLATSAGGFLSVFAADGTLDWAQPVPRRVSGASSGGAYSVDAAASGELYVTGWFFDTVAFGPAAEIVVSSAGDFGVDLFVACYAADGALRWVRTAGGPAANVDGLGIAAVPGGGCVVGGARFDGAVTFDAGLATETSLALAGRDGSVFLASYDADGVLRWAQDTGLSDEQVDDARLQVSSLGSAILATGMDNDDDGETVTLGPGTAGVLEVLVHSEEGLLLSSWSALTGELEWARADGGWETALRLGDLDVLTGGLLVAGSYFAETVLGFETVDATTLPPEDALFLVFYPVN